MLEKVLQLSLNGLMAGAVLAVPAIGLTMIFAVLRFVNFSVASHMAVGAFAGYMLNAWAGLPAWIAIFGAFIAAGAVGIASDHVALRPLRGYSALTLAIASIALNLMIESAIRFSFGGRPRDFDDVAVVGELARTRSARILDLLAVGDRLQAVERIVDLRGRVVVRDLADVVADAGTARVLALGHREDRQIGVVVGLADEGVERIALHQRLELGVGTRVERR